MLETKDAVGDSDGTGNDDFPHRDEQPRARFLPCLTCRRGFLYQQ